MRDSKRYYLRMLRVELDDLKDDIDLLIDEYTRLHDSDQMSNYVFLENLTVIRKELLGVDSFCRILDATDTEKFLTLDDLIGHLTDSFRSMVRERGLPEVIEDYVERKLLKVRDYVLREQDRLVT